jgi:hypothetical protein
MARNYNIELHQQWIGYLNPTGLVFSPQALEDAQVVINEAVVAEQKAFRELVCTKNNDEFSFVGFNEIKDIFKDVLDWENSDIIEDEASLSEYSFIHPQFNEVVRPSFVVNACNDQKIIIQSFDTNIDFDSALSTEDRWNSSVHFKLERLLREKQVSTGVLVTKNRLRLVYAPRGETSGYINFPFDIMIQPSGRLVFAAFVELFSATKVFNSKKGQALVDILDLSRKYQAKVSIELSGQVLEALYELLRGFQSANDESGNELLKQTLETNKQDVYEGLLTVLLRMVFIMYAEDRNLLAADDVYHSSYSLAGLYDRLRQDEAQNPDTMDSRYGAWAQLLSLFRLIYDGADYESEKGRVTLPARHGHLFDPSRFIFLEGRKTDKEQYVYSPKISDGVVFRVLSKLLILNSERISYRTLDVEQIGSVYETMMGFELDIAEGETRALKPQKAHGAPVPVNLTELLLIKKDRSKKLAELTDTKLTDKAKKNFDAALTIEELEVVIEKRIDLRATPFRLNRGAMLLIPSEDRRKSGSHYTPRELTKPIIEMALKPIFARFDSIPKPEEILELKICDPAMGSGAFLVEICRQLSERLVESWCFYKTKIDLPNDEDELLYAKRLIAQRCLYGVDKNHMAVNLAKLSLWLVTLAKDHSFSFLDHNFKHGDTLIGLTNKEIMAFDYKIRSELPLFAHLKDKINDALDARKEIQNASQEKNYDAILMVEEEYLYEIRPLRLVGNLIIKCFLDGKTEKERAKKIQDHQLIISNFFAAKADDKLIDYCAEQLKDLDKRVTPFHWELEFPEVFSKELSGFDLVVGNPPFANKDTIAQIYDSTFFWDWIKCRYTYTSGNSDIVAFFFRRAAELANVNSVFGFIATNTIRQGDTRSTGIGCLVNKYSFSIYTAIRSLNWPGEASVCVSIVLMTKKDQGINKFLNNKAVKNITPFLLDKGTSNDPYELKQNFNSCFLGHTIHGQGFLFDDSKIAKGTNPTSMLKSINEDCIQSYITVGDLLDEANPGPKSFVINFGASDLEDVRNKFPISISIVEEKVKPFRDKIAPTNSWNIQVKKDWWRFGAFRKGLTEKALKNDLILLTPQLSKYRIFLLAPSSWCVDKQLVAIANENLSTFGLFSILQSNIHELWCLFFGSTLEDRPLYSISSCYETFPFPILDNNYSHLEKSAQAYYEYRSFLMMRLNQGLTKIFNLYNDPDENSSEIIKLRELHQKMDESVLNSYGWGDLKLEYDFVLDLEIIEDDSAVALLERSKKKPYRYKIISELHDEILARLLKLNQDRYDEEVKLGLHKKK